MVFNNLQCLNMRPLKLILSEDWKSLDEKAWVEKYQALLQSNFKWKALWVDNSSYLMSCGDKTWVSLIGLISYTIYSPSLVVRQLGGIQQVLRTWVQPSIMGCLRILIFQLSQKPSDVIRGNLDQSIKVNKKGNPKSVLITQYREKVDHPGT